MTRKNSRSLIRRVSQNPPKTAATANGGGLGILASATMTFDELKKAIFEVKDRAPGKPFGVNLRADQPEPHTLMHTLAAAHTHGTPIDWAAVWAGHRPRRVALPGYPFQRQRFWLTPQPGAGALTAAGLHGLTHPFLGAAVALGDGRGWLVSGRVSLDEHRWLADHLVADTVILPGAAWVEMALSAGAQAGLDHLDELIIHSPLVLTEGDPVALQVLSARPLGNPEHLGITGRPLVF